jgi:aromatic amino acid aminotransferase I
MAPHSSLDIEVEGVRDTEGIAIPDPVTLQEIASRRLKAGKLVAGTAAFTTSDYFKKPVCLSASVTFKHGELTQ